MKTILKHRFLYLFILLGLTVSFSGCIIDDDVDEPTLQSQTSEYRDSWVGKYVGSSTRTNINGKTYPVSFTLNVYKYNSFYVGCGNGSSGSSGRIDLPPNSIGISGLLVTKNSIKFSPTKKYPYRIDLKKSVDKYGDLEISGVLEHYEVVNGGLSFYQKFTSISVYKK